MSVSLMLLGHLTVCLLPVRPLSSYQGTFTSLVCSAARVPGPLKLQLSNPIHGLPFLRLQIICHSLLAKLVDYNQSIICELCYSIQYPDLELA